MYVFDYNWKTNIVQSRDSLLVIGTINNDYNRFLIVLLDHDILNSRCLFE